MKHHIIFIALMLSVISCSKIILFPPNLNKIRTMKNFEWIEERSSDARFTFIYEKDLLNSNDSKARSQAVHLFLNKSFNFIKEPDRGESYAYAIVASPARMKALIGYSPQGTAFPSHNLVVGEPAVLKVAHELSHIVSIRCWGNSKPWIMEGIAVAIDDNWFGYDLYAITKYLQSTGALIHLQDMINNFYNLDSLITYPEAGCFIKYLHDFYGIEKVHALWKKGPSHIPGIFGHTLTDLERTWLERVSQADTTNIKYKTRKQPSAA